MEAIIHRGQLERLKDLAAGKATLTTLASILHEALTGASETGVGWSSVGVMLSALSPAVTITSLTGEDGEAITSADGITNRIQITLAFA